MDPDLHYNIIDDINLGADVCVVEKPKKKRNQQYSQWCSAINCKNGRYNRPDLSFFRFPTEEDRCRKWVINSRRADLINKSAKTLSVGNVLCAQHFEASEFTNMKRNQLRRTKAVPTIFSIPNPPPSLTLKRPPPKSIKHQSPPRQKKHDVDLDEQPFSSPQEPLCYRCDACGAKFEDQSSLEVHGWTHDEQFSNKRHVVCHGVEQPEISPSFDNVDEIMQDEIPHRCDICNVKFEEYSSLEIHRRTHDEEKFSHKMDISRVKFEIPSFSLDKGDEQKSYYGCDVCSAKFEEYSSLEEHRRTHDNEKNLLYKKDVSGVKSAESSSSPDKVEGQIKVTYNSDVCGVKSEEYSSSSPDKVEGQIKVTYNSDVCGVKSEEYSSSSPDKVEGQIKVTYSSDVCGVKSEEYSSLEVHGSTQDEERFLNKGRVCHGVEQPQISSSSNKVDEQVKVEIPLRCNICGVKFEENSSLEAHRRTHDEENFQNKMDVCGVRFAEISSSSPAEIDQIVVSFRCDVCGEKFDENSSLEEHGRTHHEEQFSYKKNFCEVTFDEISSSSSDKRQELSYSCDVCGLKFEEYTTLTIHKTTHLSSELSNKHTNTQRKVIKCDVCDKNFSSNSKLATHQLIHTGDKPFECYVCGKLFRTNCNLVSHQRIHTGEKPFECDVCGKTFTSSSHVTTHKRNHTGDRPFKCDDCGKDFTQHSCLTAHKTIHTGERPFKCDVCGKSFKQGGQLAAHKLIHTGERPFTCDVCGMKCARASNLTRHKVKHTGERPFKCDTCDKTFVWNIDLVRHKWRHTGEMPYGCDTCGRKFTRSNDLVKHKRIHTGEKPFTCDVCNKTFTRHISLKKHKQRHTTTVEMPCNSDVFNSNVSECSQSVNQNLMPVFPESQSLFQANISPYPTNPPLLNISTLCSAQPIRSNPILVSLLARPPLFPGLHISQSSHHDSY